MRFVDGIVVWLAVSGWVRGWVRGLVCGVRVENCGVASMGGGTCFGLWCGCVLLFVFVGLCVMGGLLSVCVICV